MGTIVSIRVRGDALGGNRPQVVYKSSRVHLKRLPTRSRRVVQGPGENAGIIDIGDGWACAFKIESHNHPSFIEPLQGAATGVGGILRDIFTMGARPVAVMDSLRFGPIRPGKDERDVKIIHRNHSILEGVVSGIAGYGLRMRFTSAR